MFSCVKHYCNTRLFRSLFIRTFVDSSNSQLNQRCFCSTVTNHKTNCFNIEEIDAHNISELISESEKCSSIVQEIRNIVERKQRFPQILKSDEIVHMCSLETRAQRKEYLLYLYKKERFKKKDADKKEKKLLERESKRTVTDNTVEHIPYGLGRNSLIISVRPRTIKGFYDKRLANAVLFGEKIVLDLGYDEFMTEKEKQYTAGQLLHVHTANRQNCNPFDVYLCNFRETSTVSKYLRSKFQNFDSSMLSATDSSYLDVFPPEKLVYLSPHADETLKEYDHNAIYIIGAFVDTIKKTKVSFNKAKLEGIKSYSLPLDDYIMWGAGSKSLTINQVFEIMLTMKNTGDWKRAFQVIPQRKIRKIDSELADVDGTSDKIFVLDTSQNKC